MALMTRRRFVVTLGLFVLIASATLVMAPCFGFADLRPLEVLKQWLASPGAEPIPEVDILIHLRAPRVVLAFLAGAALALTGAVFQALLRNPLATPYTLGVASGGSLGAVVMIWLPAMATRFGFAALRPALDALNRGWGPFTGPQIGSFVFASMIVVLIYFMGRAGSRISVMGLLLAGVTLGLICAAAILMVRYLSEPNMVVLMDRWLMGSLDVTGWSAVWPVVPFLAPGMLILLLQARRYDQLALGEEMAAGRGVDVPRLQKWSFFGGSLLTASVVAVTGPIGFVGLIVPHTIRRIVGPDHRLLLPCVFMAGGTFLVLCDTLARTLFEAREFPVGVITALLGGPFFLYLILRARRQM